MATVTTPLGKVCVTPKGAFNQYADYKFLDIVTYDGSSYLAKTDVGMGYFPDNNPDYWLKLASKGDTGTISGASATVDGQTGTQRHRRRHSAESELCVRVLRTERRDRSNRSDRKRDRLRRQDRDERSGRHLHDHLHRRHDHDLRGQERRREPRRHADGGGLCRRRKGGRRRALSQSQHRRLI